MTASVALAAPAKVNLTLHILGRRADGYHDLDSLAAFTTLHDRIEVAAAEDFSLAVEGPFAATLRGAIAEPDNLVLRAARLLAEHVGQRGGAAIRLHKTIPVAAGLGGGSADGAATLLALCRLWRIDLPATDLARIGLRLGADVPVCLASRATFMAGIGERLDAAPALPPLGIVLVNPREALSTASVFARWQGPPAPHQRPAYDARHTESLIDALRRCRNDLTAPALELAPVIAEVLAALASAPDVLLARLSGSGPSCFGLFTDAGAARHAAARLAAAHPGWWVEAGQLIGGREDLV